MGRSQGWQVPDYTLLVPAQPPVSCAHLRRLLLFRGALITGNEAYRKHACAEEAAAAPGVQADLGCSPTKRHRECSNLDDCVAPGCCLQRAPALGSCHLSPLRVNDLNFKCKNPLRERWAKWTSSWGGVDLASEGHRRVPKPFV